jgi:hypothetical protein
MGGGKGITADERNEIEKDFEMAVYSSNCCNNFADLPNTDSQF